MPLQYVLMAAVDLCNARERELNEHLEATKGNSEEQGWARAELRKLKGALFHIRKYLEVLA